MWESLSLPIYQYFDHEPLPSAVTLSKRARPDDSYIISISACIVRVIITCSVHFPEVVGPRTNQPHTQASPQQRHPHFSSMPNLTPGQGIRLPSPSRTSLMTPTVGASILTRCLGKTFLFLIASSPLLRRWSQTRMTTTD